MVFFGILRPSPFGLSLSLWFLARVTALALGTAMRFGCIAAGVAISICRAFICLSFAHPLLGDNSCWLSLLVVRVLWIFDIEQSASISACWISALTLWPLLVFALSLPLGSSVSVLCLCVRVVPAYAFVCTFVRSLHQDSKTLCRSA